MDYTVHGILQVIDLEWVAFPFSRGSSRPRNQTAVSCIAAGFFSNWAMKAKLIWDIYWVMKKSEVILMVEVSNFISLIHIV